MKLAAVFLTLLLAGCVTAPCETFNETACPESCALCGDSVIDSRVDCHTEEYCSTVADCSTMTIDNCKAPCAICPPCETCSALLCLPQTVCEEMGFSPGQYN